MCSLCGCCLFVFAALLLVLFVWFWFRPAPQNFVSYLWWKTTSPVDTVRGNIHYKNAQIHYVSYGQGKPVVLLHGGLSNKLSWFSQLPWLVRSGYRVILIDTRGHGKSTLGHHELSYQLFTEDVMQVLDHLRISKTSVIGWSDGGIIALLLAHDHPQRINKVIAISANFNPEGLTDEVLADLQQAVRNKGAEEKNATGLANWITRFWVGAGQHYSQLNARIHRLWCNSPNLSQNYLGAIHVPVLVIVGEKDLITVEHASEMANFLPNAELAVIPKAGHATPVTHADEVDQLIEGFVPGFD